MFVRLARFEGGDPSLIDKEIADVRDQIAQRENVPEGLRVVKRVLMLVDRKTGTSVDLVFCETEEDLRSADEALNAMNPGGTERRLSVEFYEVPVHTVS